MSVAGVGGVYLCVSAAAHAHGSDRLTNNHIHPHHSSIHVHSFEVWDAADGLRLLSASGPFCVVPIEGACMHACVRPRVSALLA